jgi:hypothetical protein
MQMQGIEYTESNGLVGPFGRQLLMTSTKGVDQWRAMGYRCKACTAEK